MPVGIPWDDLPRTRPAAVVIAPKLNDQVSTNDLIQEPDRDFSKDVDSVMRRVAFGVLSGASTGLIFAAVDIARSGKMLTTKREKIVGKLAMHSTIFGSFFGLYHGARRALQLTYPNISHADNIALAGALSFSPAFFVPKARPMIPYGVILVVLDVVNDMR